MTKELDQFDKLPSTEMDDVRKLWNGCLGPSRTKRHALGVLVDPRIWELERQGTVKLEEKLVRRAELVFRELVNKSVDENKRKVVNKTWRASRNARRERLQPDSGQNGEHVFLQQHGDWSS
jgi:hypothetical protein